MHINCGSEVTTNYVIIGQLKTVSKGGEFTVAGATGQETSHDY